MKWSAAARALGCSSPPATPRTRSCITGGSIRACNSLESRSPTPSLRPRSGPCSTDRSSRSRLRREAGRADCLGSLARLVGVRFSPPSVLQPSRGSIVPVDPLVALVALLGLEREGGDRAGLEALQRDRLARVLAVAVAAVLDAREGRGDLGDELSLAVSGAQLDRAVRLGGGAVGDVGVVLVLGLERGEGLLRLTQDVALPLDELAPEILALPVVHERLVVARPITLVDEDLRHRPPFSLPSLNRFLAFGAAIHGRVGRPLCESWRDHNANDVGTPLEFRAEAAWPPARGRSARFCERFVASGWQAAREAAARTAQNWK